MNNLLERIKTLEPSAVSLSDGDSNLKNAIVLNKANKAVNAIVLEFDDLFEAIRLPYVSEKSFPERCESCGGGVKCVAHVSVTDKISVRRSMRKPLQFN